MAKNRYEPRTFITCSKHQPTYVHYREIAIPPIPRNSNFAPSAFKSKSDIQSRKSMSRLSNAINWLLYFSDKKTVYSKKAFNNKHYFTFKLAFITLTLPDAQQHNDKFCKEKMLVPFLDWLTRYNNSSYVWKTETQINGNIHFHITIDTFIHWKSIRAKWNKICAAHNYCKVFQDGTNDKGNASIQIKAVRNEKEVSKYLASYMAKKNTFKIDKYKNKSTFKKLPVFSYLPEQLQPLKPSERIFYLRFISGRLWGCSSNLSNIEIRGDDGVVNFRDDEKQFLISNKAKNLGKLLKSEYQKKYFNYSEPEKRLMQVDDESLHTRFYQYENVYIHRNLSYCKIPDAIKKQLDSIKLQRKFPTQKFFTVDSLN
jgi:hypothetical protein